MKTEIVVEHTQVGRSLSQWDAMPYIEPESRRALRRLSLAALFSIATLVTRAPSLAAESPAPNAPSEKSNPQASPLEDATLAASARGTLVVHLNANAGTISLTETADTAPLELTPSILDALTTSFEGLAPSTTGDVTTYDLRGRFQPVWFAARGSDGRLKTFCISSLPPPVAAAIRAARTNQQKTK
jgi:hypothetical protein